MNVSVVIPCYNGQKFLDEAIKSINEQTVLPKEIVIVNDGSTDNSKAIIDAYVNNNKVPVIAVHQANGGVSSARNTGLSLATGEWIAFLDVDDIWYPNKLEKQFEIIKNNEAKLGLICTDYHIDYLVAGESKFSTCSFVKPLLNRVLTCDNFQPSFIQENFIGTASTIVFKRELAIRIGGFDIHLNHSEDFDFILRYSLFADVYLMQDPLVMKRHHGDNLTGDLALYYYSHLTSLKKNFLLYAAYKSYFRDGYKANVLTLMKESHDDFVIKFCNEVYERNIFVGLKTYINFIPRLKTTLGVKSFFFALSKKIIRTLSCQVFKK